MTKLLEHEHGGKTYARLRGNERDRRVPSTSMSEHWYTRLGSDTVHETYKHYIDALLHMRVRAVDRM